jgi:hypothetical protein
MSQAWAVLGLAGYLLIGCGQTENAGDSAEPGDFGAGGMAGGSSVSGGGAGQPPLLIDPVATEPLPPVPHDLCACPGVGFGLTAMLGDDTQLLSFNIANSSACGPDQPAHVSVSSGCGDDVSLSLSADAAGAVPRLLIEDRQLTYTDTANVVWTGFLPRSIGSRPDESGALQGALAISVVSAAGEERVLQLTFKLCAEWSDSAAPC